MEALVRRSFQSWAVKQSSPIQQTYRTSSISKMVLSTVKLGPPNWIKSRTFHSPNGEVARPPPYRQGLSLWVSQSAAGEPPPGNRSSGKGYFALALADSQDGPQRRIHAHVQALVDAQAGLAQAGGAVSRRFRSPVRMAVIFLLFTPLKAPEIRPETGLIESILPNWVKVYPYFSKLVIDFTPYLRIPIISTGYLRLPNRWAEPDAGRQCRPNQSSNRAAG